MQARTDADDDTTDPITGPKQIVVYVAFGTFWLRYVLADRNSYWLDELFSVEQYVLAAETLGDALRDLAITSIHPPLYQFILYYWIELFGSTETATRTLSNLFITAAILVLHRLVWRVHGSAIANWTAVVFSISYAAVLYGLETRSYALTILLAALSSYSLLLYLRALRTSDGAHRLWPGLPAGLFLVSNAALLLTHYYNAFYWAAQAIFAVVVMAASRPRGQRLVELPAIVSAYTLQLLVFLLVWGRPAYANVAGTRDHWAVDVPAASPSRIISALGEQTFHFGPVPTWIALLVLGALTVWRAADLARRRADDASRLDLAGTGYALWMVIGPASIAFLGFLAVGAERFEPKYFVYLVPHIATSGVLAGQQVWSRVRKARNPRTRLLGQNLATRPAVAALVLLTVFVIPGTIEAAAHERTDSRGTARDVLALVQSHPELDFAIYEASFRPLPFLDHYLRRFAGTEVSVDGIIQEWEEEAGEFGFEQRAPEIETHDRLIMVFVHYTTDEFPTALSRLGEMYPVHQAMVDGDGRGFVVYDVSFPFAPAGHEQVRG